MKFKSNSTQQIFLLPPTVDEFVPNLSLARVVAEVVEQLDLKPLYRKYDEDGRPAYHPKLMLKVLFYAYANGIRSSRQIAQHLERDTHFMFLAGMLTPDFRTLSDFRKNHLELLQAFFKQIVLLCMAMDMVKIGHIAIDGTKIKAAASTKQTKDDDALQKEIDRLEREIATMMAEAQVVDQSEDQQLGKNQRGDELPEALAEHQQRKARLQQAQALLHERGWNKINLTDTDSRFMKTPHGSQLAYNAQVAVDAAHQIIVANEVVTEATDHHQFIPMYEQVQENLSRTPEEVSVDAGYANHHNYRYMQTHELNAYAPDAKMNMVEDAEKPQSQYTKDKFHYDAAHDTYICPQGETLIYRETKTEQELSYRVYQSDDCSGCPARSLCLRKDNRSATRTLKVYETDGYIQRMREKLTTPEGRAKYQTRMYTAEPPIGHLKHVLGFRSFLLRGQKKVRGEFQLMCIAHNLKKVHAYKLARAA